MRKKSVALGNFDGMHIGHTAVLNAAIKAAGNSLVPCALLFTEHSVKALTGHAPAMLMSDAERQDFIKSCSCEIEMIDFKKIQNLSAREFVEDIIIKRLNAGAVTCGYNYRFGKNALGNAQTLKDLCNENGIACNIVSEVDYDFCAVSSTEIRTLIENGEIARANHMLGRKFGFSSPVIHGDERGRSWGFPTANQLLPDGFVMPKFGVYASEVTVDGKKYKGVTNIGKRPTVGTDTILSETYIIGLDENLYGKEIDIRLVEYLRPEKKFSSFNELAKQIKADTKKVKGSELTDV